MMALVAFATHAVACVAGCQHAATRHATSSSLAPTTAPVSEPRWNPATARRLFLQYTPISGGDAIVGYWDPNARVFFRWKGVHLRSKWIWTEISGPVCFHAEAAGCRVMDIDPPPSATLQVIFRKTRATHGRNGVF